MIRNDLLMQGGGRGSASVSHGGFFPTDPPADARPKPKEIRRLRTSRCRMAEVSSLAADKSLKLREFRQVFVAMIRMMFQHHVSHGGDTWVITVNPRHRDFYTKGMGFVPLGPPRTYSSVQ